jgi:hypothetical protein
VIETGGGGGGTGIGFGGGGGTLPPVALIVIVNSRCACAGRHQSAEGGFSSLRLTQNDQLPACVGVPLTRPLFASDSPGGGGSAEDRELIRQCGTATPGAREREAVRNADGSDRREVALVGEPNRPGSRGEDERSRRNEHRDEDSTLQSNAHQFRSHL